MSWETLRARYLKKMESAEALTDQAKNLRSRLGTEVPDELARQIDELAEHVTRQVTKLRENRFHVAVLGLEKAGKSAVINAWLGVEILPSKDERCTYTTTEIWSAPSEDEQYYEIEYLTAEAFDRELQQKQKAKAALEAMQESPGKDLESLASDLEETCRLEKTIRSLLGRARERRSFRDLREIRHELEPRITDPAHARAVRRIVLRTTALRAARDIVFHDVPGFNSPVEMHREQAQQKIAECDAILYVKDFRAPSREGSEVMVLKLADREDRFILSAAKTFVTLTWVDKAEDRQQFAERLEKARREWKEVPAQRILPVCPPAHLFTQGTGRPEVMRYGAGIVSRLANLGAGDGITALKDAFQAYIDNERSEVLARRCNGLCEELRRHCARLSGLLAARYPEFDGDYKDTADRDFDLAFNAWWTHQWTRIQEDFQMFFRRRIMPTADDSTDGQTVENPELARFRGRYNELIQQLPARCTRAAPENIESRYNVLAPWDDGTVHPEYAHGIIRREINQELMDEVNRLGIELASHLTAVIRELIDEAVHLLWGIREVASELAAGSDGFEQRVEHGISTLFRRFARPAVNIFLAVPRGVNGRESMLRAYLRDIKVLEEFYAGPDSSRKNLEAYLISGAWSGKRVEAVTPSAAVPVVAAGLQEAGAQPLASSRIRIVSNESRGGESDLPAVTAASSAPAAPVQSAGGLNAITAEIQEDLAALIDYLEHSVFGASGFQSYWNQELDRVRRAFHEREEEHRIWAPHVKCSYQQGHPAVRAAAPQLGEDAEFRRFVGQSLSRFRQALAEFDGPGFELQPELKAVSAAGTL